MRNATACGEAAGEVTERFYRVNRRDMVYLKFILEAYEGMNVMSTVDNERGIIRIAVMAGFEEDMDRLLAELGRQVTMEPVAWPELIAMGRG